VNGVAKWDGATWSALESGTNGGVVALTVFDDGGGPALYAAGGFSTAGGVSAKNIAKWNGVSWSALGSGVSNGVQVLTVFDDGGGPALYAGGVTGGASSNVVRWNGSSWSAVGSGVSGGVTAMTVFDDALYASGWDYEFTDVLWGGLYRLDSGDWSAVLEPSLKSGGVLSGLTVFDDGSGAALYGAFGGNGIAKWNTGSPGGWSDIGWVYGAAYTMAAFDDGTGLALYAGSRNLAKWNPGAPGSWSPIEPGLNSSIDALTVFDDGTGPTLYAGGFFTTAGAVSANRIAKSDPGALQEAGRPWDRE
jgi:hypothetical protein